MTTTINNLSITTARGANKDWFTVDFVGGQVRLITLNETATFAADERAAVHITERHEIIYCRDQELVEATGRG